MNYCRAPLLSIALVLTLFTALQAAPKLLDRPEPPPLEEAFPKDFKLPEGFRDPHRVPQQRLSFGIVYGKVLEGYEGIYPLYINRCWEGQLPGDALIVGDVLLAVDGKVMGKNGPEQISKAMKMGKRNGYFWLTRYRDGKIERFFIDFGTKAFDLTQTQMPGMTRDWRLGPLGVNGWCFQRRTDLGGTRDARQFIITTVDEEGPASGNLQVRDVILGVDGKDFSSDPRRALAKAIDEAEKEENKGKLNLKVWRQGKSRNIVLTLPVLGSYSSTSPFNCPKTEKIIDNAVSYIKANAETLLAIDEKGWINYITGLGLMATGREDVMPLVKKLAHETILKPGEKLSVEHHVSMMCWWWSYRTLFLCEYYLLTKDEAVLPTIHEYATTIAMGQSGAGTWGHTYAARANTGYLHGHLGGYGAINQMGLTMMMVLPLAKKCGVKNKEVLDAIKRGEDFFSYFIGKGTIPYGDHGASHGSYDDNGKSGSAAIVFDLLDNSKGTAFFSEMIMGSVPGGRDNGHTGHFWSFLWGGIGVARGGDKALQVYIQEMNPAFTLERQPSGRFAFQDNPGENGPKKDPKTRYDSTGARLLQLCYPKRSLYLTGKETSPKTHLSNQRFNDIFEAGRMKYDQGARAKLSKKEIFAWLKDPLPPTRNMAVNALAEQKIECEDELLAMLEDENRYARYGAAEALARVGNASEKAAKKLIEVMAQSDDVTFKSYGVIAFTRKDMRGGLLAVGKPAIPVFMKMVLEDSTDDPRKTLKFAVGRGLFYKGNAQHFRGLIAHYGIEEKDRHLLVPVIKELLTNENGAVRGITAKWAYKELTADERDQLWGDIYKATHRIAPSGIMFASGVRIEGLKLMAQHGVKEGLDMAVWYLRYQKSHGNWHRFKYAIKAIEGYGVHAKRVISELESHIAYWTTKLDNPRDLNNKKHPINRINKLIETIKAFPDDSKIELVSIAEKINDLGLEYPPKPIVIEENP